MKNTKLLIAAGLLMLGTDAWSQLPVNGVHYPAGLEGIKGGSLPEPGIYLRDDNLFYISQSGSLSDSDMLIYLQAPQLTWMTGWQILGADYGANIMVPVIYKDVNYRTASVTPNGQRFVFTQGGSRFGLGDIKIEPLLLSWHLRHFDFMAGYALWLPTGDYETSSKVNLGNDCFTHMLTLGGVYYPDKKKTWAVSILNHFEFNSQQPVSQTLITPGGGYSVTVNGDVPCSVYTLEWGFSKTICSQADLGIIGYYQRQFTDETRAAVANRDAGVAGIGPEIRSQISRWDLSLSLRYAYEFLEDDRPQGHTINFTLTKKF
jgi:hypothetical protein